MSVKRYSAPGLYSTMGLYWLLPSTVMEKSDKMGRRLELLPPLIRLLLWFPMSFGADVWVGTMGSKLDAKTIEATGFHKAMLVISWCVWRTSILMVALGVAVEVGSINFCVYLLLYLFMNLMEYHELALPL